MASSIAPIRLTRLEAELILNGLLNGSSVEQFALETDSTRFNIERQVKAIHIKIREAIVTPLPSKEGEIEQLGLSHRVYRVLRRYGIERVDELRALSPKELSDIRGIGELALQELELVLGKARKYHEGAFLWKTMENTS